jgi:lincosamide nucleotidyltransferase
MKIEAYRQLTENLKSNLDKDERVLALIALGSMAETSRIPDNWSDHDFFVITQTGEQENFRTDLAWLPAHDQIILSIRETAHGLKVLYNNGHLLEFAVFDTAELQVARVNDYRILFDKAEISPMLISLVRDELPTVNMHKELSMVLALLLVGAGRYARGEKLSAHLFIKSYALYHLLPLLRQHLAAADPSPLDTLDPIRRFEQVFPEIGAEINQILLLPPVEAALDMLELVDRLLRDTLPDYPAQAADVVKAYLEQI